ncbi:MAG: hypothetical protein FD161_1740 [Limisphaerales bacterium]|nr:MAG: hypothetical protein FD161_1740 [Limisphaerales bacterium]KAG0509176.1 MAG: hypothetical protein E1N63_1659 [Limisphaerales bacterium]TXT52484.1 MAG: hypothetical protein FD140_708 [Limisphaerales bacterium]
MGQAVGAAVSGPLVNAFNQFNGTAGNINATLAGLNLTMANLSGSMAGVAEGTISTAQQLSLLNGAMAGFQQQVWQFGTHVFNMSASINNLNAQVAGVQAAVNGLGGQVSAAITAGMAANGNANQSMLAKLDGIKDVLMTNNLGSTNNFTLNSTNGNISITNIVQANFPQLADVESFAFRSKTNADLLGGFNPSTDSINEVQSATDTANQTTPNFGILASGYVPVQVGGGFSEGFLKMVIPKPAGFPGVASDYTIDMNPWTLHQGALQGTLNWFRAACAWLFTVLFLIKCNGIAENYFLQMGKVGQLHTPKFTVLGTHVGKLAWPIYRVTFLGLAVALQASITLMLTGASGLGIEATTGGVTGGVAGLVGNLTRDVFIGLTGDVVLLLDKIFPLALMVSQLLFLLTSRFHLMVAWWSYQMAIRLLPA